MDLNMMQIHINMNHNFVHDTIGNYPKKLIFQIRAKYKSIKFASGAHETLVKRATEIQHLIRYTNYDTNINSCSAGTV